MLHVEQVTIDADKERAVATNRGAQDGIICRVPTHVSRQIGWLNNHGHAAKKCGELVSLTFGEAEFLHQLSSHFSEYEFGSHKLMVQ